MEKLLGLIKSRKFWAAIVGVILVLIHEYIPNFPVSDDQITEIVYLIVAFIIGTALESKKA